MTKKKNAIKDHGNISDFLLGLGLGAIGASILSAISKPVCPNPKCRQRIDRGSLVCPYCGVELVWR